MTAIVVLIKDPSPNGLEPRVEAIERAGGPGVLTGPRGPAREVFEVAEPTIARRVANSPPAFCALPSEDTSAMNPRHGCCCPCPPGTHSTLACTARRLALDASRPSPDLPQLLPFGPRASVLPSRICSAALKSAQTGTADNRMADCPVPSEDAACCGFTRNQNVHLSSDASNISLPQRNTTLCPKCHSDRPMEIPPCTPSTPLRRPEHLRAWIT